MRGRRRVVVASLVVLMVVACGLDRGGELSSGGYPIPDSSTIGSESGGNNDASPPDGANGDAPIDGRPDARPVTDLGDCALLKCQSGSDPNCTDETCDSPQWAATNLNGGSTTTSGGDCYTKTTAGGSAFYHRDQDEQDSYFYELRYLVRIALETKSTIGEIGPAGSTVRIDVDGTKLRACAGLKCTPDTTIPIATGFVVRVYGQMGKKRLFGSLILQIDCVEKATLDLDGPFIGTGKVTARVGCLAAATGCDLLLDDIVFRVAPN